MTSVEEKIANFERNIAKDTGRSVEEWVALLGQQGFEKHGAMMAWMKAEHGLSHAVANHLAKRALEAAKPRSIEDPVAHLFEGGKEELRPLYEYLADQAMSLGPDVELAPKKANVSVRRRKQFALIQPTTRTRIDLGLILKARPPGGRLEPSGSFNAMFTHRIKLASLDEVDGEVLSWMKEAYDEAL
jgi:hypothetical protein